MKKRLFCLALTLVLLVGLLPPAEAVSGQTYLEEARVRVVDSGMTFFDWTHYVTYQVGSDTYRSYDLTQEQNLYFFRRLSDADKRQVARAFAFAPNERMRQFGDQGSKEVTDYANRAGGWDEAAEIFKRRLANKRFPVLSSFYSQEPKQLPDEVRNALESHEIEYYNDMYEVYQIGKTAYNELTDLQKQVTEVGVKGLSGQLIQLITDKIMAPAITPAGVAGIASDLAQEIIGIVDQMSGASDSVMQSLGIKERQNPGSLIRLLERQIDCQGMLATRCRKAYLKGLKKLEQAAADNEEARKALEAERKKYEDDAARMSRDEVDYDLRTATDIPEDPDPDKEWRLRREKESALYKARDERLAPILKIVNDLKEEIGYAHYEKLMEGAYFDLDENNMHLLPSTFNRGRKPYFVPKGKTVSAVQSSLNTLQRKKEEWIAKRALLMEMSEQYRDASNDVNPPILYFIEEAYPESPGSLENAKKVFRRDDLSFTNKVNLLLVTVNDNLRMLYDEIEIGERDLASFQERYDRFWKEMRGAARVQQEIDALYDERGEELYLLSEEISAMVHELLYTSNPTEEQIARWMDFRDEYMQGLLDMQEYRSELDRLRLIYNIKNPLDLERVQQCTGENFRTEFPNQCFYMERIDDYWQFFEQIERLTITNTVVSAHDMRGSYVARFDIALDRLKLAAPRLCRIEDEAEFQQALSEIYIPNLGTNTRFSQEFLDSKNAEKEAVIREITERRRDFVPVKTVASGEDPGTAGLQAAPVLAIGGVLQFTARTVPANATDPAIIWDTTDSQVAAVDENGLVTGISDGTAVITARARDSVATLDYKTGRYSYDPAPLTFPVTVGSGAGPVLPQNIPGLTLEDWSLSADGSTVEGSVMVRACPADRQLRLSALDEQGQALSQDTVEIRADSFADAEDGHLLQVFSAVQGAVTVRLEWAELPPAPAEEDLTTPEAPVTPAEPRWSPLLEQRFGPLPTPELVPLTVENGAAVNFDRQADGTYLVPEGALVYLACYKVPDKDFSHWTSTGAPVGNGEDMSAYLVMPAEPVTVTPVWGDHVHRFETWTDLSPDPCANLQVSRCACGKAKRYRMKDDPWQKPEHLTWATYDGQTPVICWEKPAAEVTGYTMVCRKSEYNEQDIVSENLPADALSFVPRSDYYYYSLTAHTAGGDLSMEPISLEGFVHGTPEKKLNVYTNAGQELEAFVANNLLGETVQVQAILVGYDEAGKQVAMDAATTFVPQCRCIRLAIPGSGVASAKVLLLNPGSCSPLQLEVPITPAP